MRTRRTPQRLPGHVKRDADRAGAQVQQMRQVVARARADVDEDLFTADRSIFDRVVSDDRAKLVGERRVVAASEERLS